jgi:hypothetical protein
MNLKFIRTTSMVKVTVLLGIWFLLYLSDTWLRCVLLAAHCLSSWKITAKRALRIRTSWNIDAG